MHINRFVCSFFIFFFFVAYSVAQEEKAAIPLKEILLKISQQHQVKFNYLEDEIVVYAVVEPNKNWSLAQKIDYLKKKTLLQFKLISQKYYTIFNDKKLDKPLCGFLVDIDTEKAIENAVIKIDNSSISVFSNENGYFELPKISADLIEIQHQSYQSFSVNPADLYVPNCPKFKLKSISQTLDEVLTQRYLATGISKQNDGAVIVKPKKFGLLPGLTEADVLQTMQQIPGIISIDETISNISVRGGTHDQNLFLWNGIRMFQTGHFFGLISAFNPSLAQTISITKNGSSAFYGESVSSLVAISSLTNSVEKNNSSISTNMISAEFNTKLKLSEKSNLTVSGRRSLTDFFQSPTYKNYSNRVFQNTVITNLSNNEIVDYQSDVEFYFYDFTAQLQQKIGSSHELNIDVIAIENALQFNQSSMDLSKKSDLKQQNFGTSLQWKTSWSQSHFTELEAYFSNYDLNSLNETLENSQILNQKNKVLDTGLRLKNSNIISKTLVLHTGYQFNETGVTNFDKINSPLFSRTITNVLRTHAAIAEGIFENESSTIMLKAGFRANYFDKFHLFLLEPRIQLSQALSKNLRLEILGEQKSQTLSQIIDLRRDFLGIEKRRWTLADNDSIPVQKSNQLSIGLTFSKNKWLLTLDNFYKKVNGITSSSQGFLNQFELVKSTGDYTIFGAEFLVQKSFNRFYTWLSYAYNDNKYDFGTLYNSSFVNNYEVKNAISWAGIYEWRKLKLALGAKWHTGRPITTPTSFMVTETNSNIVYNSPNNTRLAAYFQVNFSASKDWRLKGKMTLQTSLSILNLFNTKNSLNRFYRVNSDSTVESINIHSLDMTPNFNIKLSF
jgi:hypothetical protein